MQRFAALKKSSLNSEKTRSAAEEEGCTVCKQQTSEGIDLRIFHHSSLSTSEETSSTFAR